MSGGRVWRRASLGWEEGLERSTPPLSLSHQGSAEKCGDLNTVFHVHRSPSGAGEEPEVRVKETGEEAMGPGFGCSQLQELPPAPGRVPKLPIALAKVSLRSPAAKVTSITPAAEDPRQLTLATKPSRPNHLLQTKPPDGDWCCSQPGVSTSAVWHQVRLLWMHSFLLKSCESNLGHREVLTLCDSVSYYLKKTEKC